MSAEPAAGLPVQRRTLRADVVLMGTTKGLGLLLALATSVTIARALGPSGRGTLAVAFSLSGILTQLGSLGVVSANPYFVAQEPGVRGSVVSNSMWLATSVGFVLALVGVVLKLVAPGTVSGLDWLVLGLALGGIVPTLAGMFFQSVLLGEDRMLPYNLVELGIAALLLVALVVGFTVFGMGVVGALVTLIAARLATALWYGGLVWQKGQLARPDFGLVRRMLGYGLRVYTATLVAFLVIRVDMLLVNAYRGTRQAGLYAVAVSFVDALYLIPTVVAVNVFARVARGMGDERSARAFRNLAPLYALVCLASVPLMDVIVRVLYGHAFTYSITLYWLLAPGVFALGMVDILAQHFAGRGFPLGAVVIWVAGLVVNLAIDFALLPSHGTWVASMASSVAYILILVLHVALFASRSGGYRQLWPDRRELTELIRTSLPWRARVMRSRAA